MIKIQADALYSLIQSPHLAGAPKQQKRKYMHYKHPLYGLKRARKEESQAREMQMHLIAKTNHAK